MGQQQSKINDSIKDNYIIIKTISPVQYWIKHRKKGNQLQLRILNFPLEEELLEYIKLLDRRKKIVNPHLFQLIEYERFHDQHRCSSIFRLKTITNFAFKTVKQDIYERNSLRPIKHFTEEELWSILYSCCQALFNLYSNRFPHQSLSSSQIYIDTSGIIKLADAVLVRGTKNYLAMMQEDLVEDDIRYIPPQLKNLVDDNNFYSYDKQKSDVYILGMIILEIGCLTPVKYYNLQTKQYHFEIIPQLLASFKMNYPNKISDIVEKMLENNVQLRPKFQDLIYDIQQKTIFTNSLGQSNDQCFSSRQKPVKNQRQTIKIYSKPASVVESPKQKLNSQPPNSQNSIIKINQSFKTQILPAKQVQQPQPNINHQINFHSTTLQNSYQANQPFQPRGQLYQSKYVRYPNLIQSTNIVQPNNLIQPNSLFQPNNFIQPTNLIQQTNYITNNFTHPIPIESKQIKVSNPPMIYPRNIPNIFPYNNPVQISRIEQKPLAFNNQQPIIAAQSQIKPVVSSKIIPDNFAKFSFPSQTPYTFTHTQHQINFNNPNLTTNQPVKIVQQTEKLNSVIKSIHVNQKQQINYTPYHDLMNLTGGTSQFQSINTVKKQLFNSNTTPVQFLNFTTPFPPIPTVNTIKPQSIKLQGLNKKVQQFVLKEDESMKNKRFSQSRFGGIQLPRMNAKKQEILLPNQKDKILQIQNKQYLKQIATSNIELKLDSLSSFKIQEEFIQEGVYVIENTNIGRYEGFKLNDKKHGLGRMHYLDGGYYEGEWKDNHMDGYGKLFYSDGRVAYQGYWVQDLFQGKGRIFNNSMISNHNNEINYLNFSQFSQGWLYYQGQFNRDTRHGKGMIKFITNQIFYGNFENGFIQGQGSFHCNNGEIIEGRWSKNILLTN